MSKYQGDDEDARMEAADEHDYAPKKVYSMRKGESSKVIGEIESDHGLWQATYFGPPREVKKFRTESEAKGFITKRDYGVKRWSGADGKR